MLKKLSKKFSLFECLQLMLEVLTVTLLAYDSDKKDLPLIWEKVSDMIFKYIDDRFENVISEYWLKEHIKCKNFMPTLCVHIKCKSY